VLHPLPSEEALLGLGCACHREKGDAAARDSSGAPDEPLTLDESIAQHFDYIQRVSTPQEVQQLLPALQHALSEVGAMHGWDK
jgi:hypothetical protein